MRNLFAQSCMDRRLDECRAVELWSRVVGEGISRQCLRPKVDKGLMTVSVPNASLRHELLMNRSGIYKEINRLIGKEIIKDIRFVS